MSHHHTTDTLKHVADVAAVSITAATLMQWLPPIAAGLTIIWVVIQILDYLLVKRRIPQCLWEWFRKR